MSFFQKNAQKRLLSTSESTSKDRKVKVGRDGKPDAHEPLKMILDHGLSCAIFAPGWVYECLGQSQFDSNEIMFWGILSELLIPRSVKVPFSTSFCQGYGEKYFMKGQVLSDAPWYNLGLQQVQPTFSQSQFVSYTVSKILEHEDTDQEIAGEKKSEEPLTEGEEKVDEHPTEGEKKEKLRIEVDSCERQLACPKMKLALCDAYQGGGCLSLTAKRLESLPVLFRIFKVDATRETSLHISVTWKMPQDSSCTFGIVLSNDGDKTEKGLWVLCTETDLSDAQKNIVEKMTLQDQDQAVTPSSATLVQYVNCNKKDRSSTSKDGDWLTSNFTVDLRDRNLNQELSLSVVLIPSIQQEVESCTDSHMSLWIGHLQVHGDTDSLPIAKSPCVGHLKCLQAEVNSQLSKENIKEIMTNPCFTLENSCLSTIDPAIASQHQVQDTTQNSLMVSSSAQEKNPSADISELMPDKVDTLNSISRTILDLTTEDPATPGSNLASPYTLYVLKWNVIAKGVDHFLVFCNDQTGARHFIGHALTNSFVYKYCGQHGNIRSFTIQPVMSLTNLPREETLFIL